MAPRKKPSPLQGHKERLKGEQVHTNRKRPRGHRAHPLGSSPTPAKLLFDDVTDTLGGGDQEVYAAVGFGIGISKTLAGDWEISGKYLSHIDFKIPGEPADAEPKLVTIVSKQAPISIENLESHTISDKWRIIRALKPVKGAPHGGFILERLERPTTHGEE